MASKLGLWIDNGKAYLIQLNGNGEERKKLESEVDPHSRYHGGTGKAGSSTTMVGGAENKAEHRRTNQLKAWYKEVLEAVSQAAADSIVIMGPGSAKTHILHELEKIRPLAQKLTSVETTDQLTENQIAEAVRNYFNPEEKDKIPSYRKAPGA